MTAASPWPNASRVGTLSPPTSYVGSGTDGSESNTCGVPADSGLATSTWTGPTLPSSSIAFFGSFSGWPCLPSLSAVSDAP